ncbi:MAG: TIGR00730 family Rossman fold protein [Thermoactinomyces sp.]
MKNICVFAGSNPGKNPEYQAAAKSLGLVMAKSGLGLVYGGSSVGLMGVVADTVLENGGTAVGVMPTFLSRKEIKHHRLTHFYETEGMHERKAKMGELSDAFIALPGGYGTFEEVFEVLSWGQLGIHHKPIGLLNVAGYFDPLVQMVQKAIDDGFIRPEHFSLFVCESNAEVLVKKLFAYRPPKPVLKWEELSQKEKNQ